MKAILAAIERLSKTHAEHISQYGTGNEQRLTGKHEVNILRLTAAQTSNACTNLSVCLSLWGALSLIILLLWSMISAHADQYFEWLQTCDMNTFKYGVADRGSSIRIPLPVQV